MPYISYINSTTLPEIHFNRISHTLIDYEPGFSSSHHLCVNLTDRANQRFIRAALCPPSVKIKNIVSYRLGSQFSCTDWECCVFEVLIITLDNFHCVTLTKHPTLNFIERS